MSAPVFWPALIGFAALTVALAVVLVRRGLHPVVAGAALVVGTAAVWIVGVTLQFSNWRDTDGWVDCYPACNAWHATGALLMFAPPVAGLVGVVAVLIAWLVRRRRASEAPGRP